MIGEALYKRAKLSTFKPRNQRQVALIEKSIRPIFESLATYAKTELKSDLPFELRIVTHSDVYAPYVMPGGIVVIPTGAVTKYESSAEADQAFAFMLAHEFSHALRTHKTKMVQLSLVDGIAMASEFKKLTKDFKQDLASVRDLSQLLSFDLENASSLLDKVCTAKTWKPSLEQDQEHEADVCGMLLLNRLSKSLGKPFDAMRGVKEYERVTRETAVNEKKAPPSGRRVFDCPVVATHPALEQRMQNLSAYAATLTAGGTGAGPSVATSEAATVSDRRQQSPAPSTARSAEPAGIESGSGGALVGPSPSKAPVPAGQEGLTGPNQGLTAPAAGSLQAQTLPRYAVQIGAFRVKGSAFAVRDLFEARLKGAPWEATIAAHVHVSTDTLFRVMVGDFDSAAEAWLGARRARALGYVDAFVTRLRGGSQ